MEIKNKMKYKREIKIFSKYYDRDRIADIIFGAIIIIAATVIVNGLIYFAFKNTYHIGG